MLQIDTPHGPVSAEWNGLEHDADATFILAHGAGGTLSSAQLVGISKLLADQGFRSLRFNFVYSEQGRKAPDRMPKLIECFNAVALEASEPGVPLFLGGRSMGGRAASHLVADLSFACTALVFLAYPLHPPGKPERLRTEHLSRINVPMLFVQGTRDPFATPELLHQTVDSLKKATLIEIDGADHSFKVPGRKPASINEELTDNLCTFARSLIHDPR
ncbi:MAG: alpha/beta hydrolase family protein [Actinomycetota bacterium]